MIEWQTLKEQLINNLTEEQKQQFQNEAPKAAAELDAEALLYNLEQTGIKTPEAEKRGCGSFFVCLCYQA